MPQARESLAGQQRAGTDIRASHSERGSRFPWAASEQEDQPGRAGSGSDRGKEDTPTYHGDSRAGLLCPRGQFTPRNIYLLTGGGPYTGSSSIAGSMICVYSTALSKLEK